MTEISTAAGGAESPAAEEGSGHNAPQTCQEAHAVSGEGNDALPATTGDHKAHQNQGDDGACLSSTPIGDAGIAPNRATPASPSAPNPDSAHSVPGPSADAVPTSENLPSSLGTTAVSSPARRQGNNAGTGAQTTSPGTMFLLVALAKFAAFTDVFLSGLIVPLVPAILEYQAKVPHEQVQVWTSVFIAAYGGAFAVVSPLMPFLTRQGPLIWVVLVVGLACAGAAFALIQLSSTLYPLILARALQGLSAAATTGTCSGMLATAAGVNGRANTLSWITPALLQSTALAAAPVTAGYLYENVSTDAVFYLAYALVASNVLFSLVAAKITPYGQISVNSQGSAVATTSVSGGYGTTATEVDQPQAPPSGAEHRQRTASRSRSPTSASARSARSSSVSTILPEPSSWSPRLLVATYGYLVLGVTATALQTVLPLFVQRHFHWSVARTGFMFVPLSVPAVLVGPLAGLLATRVPMLTRFLAAIGFGAAIPALISLGSFGRLAPSTVDIERAFFGSLAGLSLATGLSGDPLIKEITSIVGPSAINDPLSAAAQATSIPNVANAWGSLIGPLLAGAIRWIWGWETLTRALAYVSGFTGVVVLLFLQGWIGSPHSETGRRRGEPSNDEEAAPLLANAHPDGGSYRPREQMGSHRSKKGTSGAPSQDANKASPRARKKSGHRRHFSVDNFSVATTTGPGSVDSATSQVRFQAALETLQEPTTKRPPTGDSSRATAERRYTMREAPHAPTTDPLLAVGSRYVIDEERSIVPEGETPKRHVVVFAEGTAPPELLERHRHHIVAINALDGTAQMVSSSTADNHAVSVTEEAGDDQPEFSEATSRRYVVVVVEEGDDEASP